LILPLIMLPESESEEIAPNIASDLGGGTANRSRARSFRRRVLAHTGHRVPDSASRKA
jgi:hypothetical protein